MPEEVTEVQYTEDLGFKAEGIKTEQGWLGVITVDGVIVARSSESNHAEVVLAVRDARRVFAAKLVTVLDRISA